MKEKIVGLLIFVTFIIIVVGLCIMEKKFNWKTPPGSDNQLYIVNQVRR